MVAHMKTTIELPSSLLKEAKAVAAKEGTTLRALIESALRQALQGRKGTKRAFVLRDASYGGGGLREGFDMRDFKRILDVSYGDRGGESLE
jgi:hypothetical protein